jgi:hypothetical protein
MAVLVAGAADAGACACIADAIHAAAATIATNCDRERLNRERGPRANLKRGTKAMSNLNGKPPAKIIQSVLYLKERREEKLDLIPAAGTDHRRRKY